MADVVFKYHEDKRLDEFKKYIEETYTKHYSGLDGIQTFDLIMASGHSTGFTIGSILKYASRYGKKNGYNRDDLLKIVHYALLELYFHDKYIAKQEFNKE